MNRLAFVLVASFAASAVAASPDPYAALRLYDGSWKAGADRLTDTCALVGTYFVCQQTVNGKTGALLVFVPKDEPGEFYTQNVLPDGRATGRGDLRIDGNTWTYGSRSEQNGRTTHYRTVNVFTGTDHIHSESSESSDGDHWTVTRAGDLDRLK